MFGSVLTKFPPGALELKDLKGRFVGRGQVGEEGENLQLSRHTIAVCPHCGDILEPFSLKTKMALYLHQRLFSNVQSHIR